MNEIIWRNVKGYEGSYLVNNNEEVKSLLTGRILKTQNNGKTTHQYIKLRKDGKNVKEYLHRIVAFAFPEICGEWFEGAECNHKDENPKNNIPENLEWVTHQFNNAYGTKGERHSDFMSKEPIVQMKDGVVIKEWKSAERAGKELGISSNAIRRCCKHKDGYKSCGGFNWEFK